MNAAIWLLTPLHPHSASDRCAASCGGVLIYMFLIIYLLGGKGASASSTSSATPTRKDSDMSVTAAAATDSAQDFVEVWNDEAHQNI